MKSTPETILEAQRVLAEFLENERQKQRRPDARGDSPASFSSEDEAQHGPDSPAQRAADYAKARNQNLRPMRQINEADENARAGRASALEFLERRRRSVTRK